jgi:tRNA pseudouridine55 synthase
MANLTQLRMLEDLDGLLLVDKPAGIAFSSVVKTVKRKFNLVKVGHGGSLDAMASGLFVVLLGSANKFAGDIMGADRSYTGTMKFGETTDTGDRYGRPIPLPGRVMKPGEAKGDLFQTEPRFCAVRREGSAQYDIADTGEHTQFLAHVYRFEVGEKDASSGESGFSLVASKGVIVRALAQDLGATLMSLRRTKIGKLSVDDAIPFDKLLETDVGNLPSCVVPISRALR